MNYAIPTDTTVGNLPSKSTFTFSLFRVPQQTAQATDQRDNLQSDGVRNEPSSERMTTCGAFASAAAADSFGVRA